MEISEKDKVSYKVAREFLDSLNLPKVRFLDYSYGKGITYTYGSYEVSIYISFIDSTFNAYIKSGSVFIGEFCPLFNPIENSAKFLQEFIAFMQSAYTYDFNKNEKKIKTVHVKKLTARLKTARNGCKFLNVSKHTYICKAKLREVEKKYWN